MYWDDTFPEILKSPVVSFPSMTMGFSPLGLNLQPCFSSSSYKGDKGLWGSFPSAIKIPFRPRAANTGNRKRKVEPLSPHANKVPPFFKTSTQDLVAKISFDGKSQITLLSFFDKAAQISALCA